MCQGLGEGLSLSFGVLCIPVTAFAVCSSRTEEDVYSVGEIDFIGSDYCYVRQWSDM